MKNTISSMIQLCTVYYPDIKGVEPRVLLDGEQLAEMIIHRILNERKLIDRAVLGYSSDNSDEYDVAFWDGVDAYEKSIRNIFGIED